MKHFVMAIVGIVLIIAIAGSVFSQGKRVECLNDCKTAGDSCAASVQGMHRDCIQSPTACDQIRNDALRRCQGDYDVCRYTCDVSRF